MAAITDATIKIVRALLAATGHDTVNETSGSQIVLIMNRFGMSKNRAIRLLIATRQNITTVQRIRDGNQDRRLRQMRRGVK